MNGLGAALLCAILSVSAGTNAQEAAKVQEPEYLGVFFLIDSATGNLLPLERATAEIKAQMRAMGLGGSKGLLSINGAKSSVRFRQGETLEFVVLAGSQQVDPQTLFTLSKLESKSGKRQLTVASYGFTGGGTKANPGAVPFNAAKHGGSSFKLTPAQPLQPGEYALSTGDLNKFCFGIDPASPKH